MQEEKQEYEKKKENFRINDSWIASK